MGKFQNRSEISIEDPKQIIRPRGKAAVEKQRIKPLLRSNKLLIRRKVDQAAILVFKQ